MKNVPFFRWFDAGDIIDLQHLMDIYQVARNTPHITHWLPTKEWQHKKQFQSPVKPDNVTVRVSAPFKNKPFKPNKHETHSVVLTKSEFDKYENDPTVNDKIWFCPSHLQDGQCKDCRACWDLDVECIAYKYHGKKSDGMSTNLLQVEKLNYRKVA